MQTVKNVFRKENIVQKIYFKKEKDYNFAILKISRYFCLLYIPKFNFE